MYIVVKLRSQTLNSILIYFESYKLFSPLNNYPNLMNFKYIFITWPKRIPLKTSSARLNINQKQTHTFSCITICYLMKCIYMHFKTTLNERRRTFHVPIIVLSLC